VKRKKLVVLKIKDTTKSNKKVYEQNQINNIHLQ